MVALAEWLRLELDPLAARTTNLTDRFPKLPDGAAIRAHKEAADALLSVRSRGLPVFLQGVSFLVSRLDLYSRNASLLDDTQLLEIKSFRSKLATITPCLDSRRGTTRFTGFHPMYPDMNSKKLRS